MERTEVYAPAVYERAMKVGQVIEAAMQGRIKWYQAAEVLGISCRQMLRWRLRYQREGYTGLLDRRRRRPSPKRISDAVVAKVLTLYREQYHDFNVRHFHEQLAGHGIQVGYTWTKAMLHEAGLVRRGRKRGHYRRRRERRPLPGMLVHLDGSTHRWFASADGAMQDMLVLLDDASGEILAARFVPQEGTLTSLQLLRELVQSRGTFTALYTDRGSHFVRTPVAGEPPDRRMKTQLEQVLDELGIELIAAHSPEARGRSERMWGTLQGRLPQELRRAGATTYEAANAFLARFLPRFNRRFGVPCAAEGSAFLPVARADLDRVFALRFDRTVARDNTVRFHNRVLQLPKIAGCTTLANRRVEVRVQLDRTLEIFLGRRLLATFGLPADLSEEQIKAA